MDNDNRNDVPYIAFESEIARLERIVHRSVILTCISIVAFAVTNIIWLVTQ